MAHFSKVWFRVHSK